MQTYLYINIAARARHQWKIIQVFPVMHIALKLLLVFSHHSDTTSRFDSSAWKVYIPGCEPQSAMPLDCEKFSLSILTIDMTNAWWLWAWIRCIYLVTEQYAGWCNLVRFNFFLFFFILLFLDQCIWCPLYSAYWSPEACTGEGTWVVDSQPLCSLSNGITTNLRQICLLVVWKESPCLWNTQCIKEI